MCHTVPVIRNHLLMVLWKSLALFNVIWSWYKFLGSVLWYSSFRKEQTMLNHNRIHWWTLCWCIAILLEVRFFSSCSEFKNHYQLNRMCGLLIVTSSSFHNLQSCTYAGWINPWSPKECFQQEQNFYFEIYIIDWVQCSEITEVGKGMGNQLWRSKSTLLGLNISYLHFIMTNWTLSPECCNMLFSPEWMLLIGWCHKRYWMLLAALFDWWWTCKSTAASEL